MRKFYVTALCALAAFFSYAAAPSSYYDKAENKGGRDLLTALYDIVGTHTNVGYDGLWSLYRTTDVRPNGTIWDMYSTKEWRYGSEQCGNYDYVGDCYNREHSMPKSWFDEGSPMKSDAFHIYPTDGKVNNQRSNYPFGECANGTYLPSHGGVRPLGRLGRSTFPGYSGTVFEPDDEYKGDFARSYFYMAAAYYSRIGQWHSDMLAGNNYPAFRGWAVNLLLKWHRQDPVSEKETVRNDAVYARQHNRNPFIDHPEMVEYIWGDRKEQHWTSQGPAEPEFVLPAEGSLVDFGTVAAAVGGSRSLTVRTTGMTAPVGVTVAGTGFSTSVASIPAAQTNTQSGYSLTVDFKAAAGSYSGVLTLSSGGVTRAVSLAAVSMAGLPAGDAEHVSDESFDAVWGYAGDTSDGNYLLDVRQGGEAIAGYPRRVPAQAGRYTVEGLDPLTTYVYTLSSDGMKSREVSVTTAAPVPSIEFLFDGSLYFSATPGEPSEAAELLIDAQNIDSDITISVGEPFELSTDRSVWTRRVPVPAEQDRVYLRLYSATAGTFSATLLATAGSYRTEGIEVRGDATAAVDFLEDFEAQEDGLDTYSPFTYHGTAAVWNFSNAGIWRADGGASSAQSVRFGKESDSYIAMAENRTGGVGTVSFEACYWSDSEKNPVLSVDVSTDGGVSWRSAGKVTVTSADYASYSVFVGEALPARVRIQQTSGKRLNLDNLGVTRHSSGVAAPDAARHSWDAFARGGDLVVNVDAEELEVGVYALDGSTVHSGVLGRGEHVFGSLPAGMYIVAATDFGRRVILR